MWVRNNKGNIFVGNLPPDFPDERLAEAFDPFGIVLSAAVARDPNTGARLRYGFVDIATERAATKAISALDGTEIDGCKLNVKASEKKAKTANGKAMNGKPGPRRQPPRPAPRRILTREDGAVAPAQQSPMAQSPMAQSPMPQSTISQSPLSQSAIAREQAEAIEPPPRRDFEVVVRPTRRKTTPNFQVERRTLPRRV
jgi:RNA recognition motif-containing protein